MLSFERRSNKVPRPGRPAALPAAVRSPSPRCRPRRHGPAATTCTRAGRRPGRRRRRTGGRGLGRGCGAVVSNTLPRGRRAARGAAATSPGARQTRRARHGSSRPPAGERLVGATLWRAGDADGGATRKLRTWCGSRARNSDSRSTSATTRPAARPESAVTPHLCQRANGVAVGPANLGGNLYATATCRGLERLPLRRNRRRR